MDSKVPRLIVNGDDLGRSESNTRGIIEGHRSGIVTSTSIVANGPSFDMAVRLAHENPGLGIGVHLFLHEYRPIANARDIPTLVRHDGSFYPQVSCFGRITLRQVSLKEIRREWEAQVQRILEVGIRPTHLDGHCHIHAHPALAGLVAEIAATFHIPATRMPSESLTRGSCRSVQRYLEAVLLDCACWRTRATWKRRLRFPDSFSGFMQGGRMNRRILETMAASLAPGVSELMVHPGISNDDRPFNLGYDWRGDLATMTTYTREQFERRFGVRLVSYREAWN